MSIMQMLLAGGAQTIIGAWDAVTNRNVNVTLSNNDLTATGTNATQAGGIQSTNSLAAGARYIEYLIGGTTNNRWVGCGNASTITGNGAALGGDNNAIGYVSGTGNVTKNNVVLATLATFGTGDIIGMKIDLAGGTASFNKNGGAFSSNFTLPTGAQFLHFAGFNGGAVTLQKTPTYSIPAGYNYWGN